MYVQLTTNKWIVDKYTVHVWAYGVTAKFGKFRKETTIMYFKD